MLSLASTTTARAVLAFHAAVRGAVRTIGPASATTASTTTATRISISATSDGNRMRTAAACDRGTNRRLGKATRSAW